MESYRESTAKETYRDLSDEQLERRHKQAERRAKRHTSPGYQRAYREIHKEVERREDTTDDATTELSAAETQATFDGASSPQGPSLENAATDDDGNLIEPDMSVVAELASAQRNNLLAFYREKMAELASAYENAYNAETDTLDSETHKTAARRYKTAERIRDQLEAVHAR